MRVLGLLMKTHWKRLLWMWLFPVAFLSTAFVPAFEAHPRIFFILVDLPALFGCFYLGAQPVRDHQMSIRQGFVLLVVVPFLIWASLIFGLFGLLALTKPP